MLLIVNLWKNQKKLFTKHMFCVILIVQFVELGGKKIWKIFPQNLLVYYL